MPTGSVTLLEAAKYGDDQLKRGVVETLIQESPILEMLPQTSISGNALKVQVENTLPAPAFRDVNESYSRTHGTDTERYFGTAILGGEVFVDNYLVRVRGNVTSVKARQYAKFAKAMSRTYDKYFFDGTGTAKDFKGINALIDEGLGQSVLNASGGGALTLAKMDEAHDEYELLNKKPIITREYWLQMIKEVQRKIDAFTTVKALRQSRKHRVI